MNQKNLLLIAEGDGPGLPLNCLLVEPRECPDCHRMVVLAINRFGKSLCVPCDAKRMVN